MLLSNVISVWLPIFTFMYNFLCFLKIISDHGRVTSWLEWDNCKQTAEAPGSLLVQVRKKYCVSRWSHDQDHDELRCDPDEPLNETRSCEDPGNLEPIIYFFEGISMLISNFFLNCRNEGFEMSWY